MKPFVLIAAAALLLTGCQSKKEICAGFSVGNLEWQYKNASKYRNQLGIKTPIEGHAYDQVYSFCEWYKS